MEDLMIKIYDSGKAIPDHTITIPVSKINIGKQLLPEKAKTILGREGIEISMLTELANKNISKGSLIEIESGTGSEIETGSSFKRKRKPCTAPALPW
jgi:hypothetical protein